MPRDEHPLTVALARGRILQENLELLGKAGIQVVRQADDRRLVLHSECQRYRFLVIRSADVVTYVQLGAAQAGIVGSDMLMEAGGGGLYELLDLRTGRCRLVSAARADFEPGVRRLRVATRHVNTARLFFAARGEQVQIIPLYGALELAPNSGIADQIVDLVETGRTLESNGLVERELIARVSARLAVNKAAMRLRHREIEELLQALKGVLPDVAAARDAP